MTGSKLKRSHIIDTLDWERVAGVPTLTSSGDFDDHLKMTSLFAHGLQARSVAREACEVLLEPTSPWRERRKAFREILSDARRHPVDGFVGTWVNPDALVPQRESDAAFFPNERRWVFDAMKEAVDQGGWRVIRLSPRLELEEDFQELDADSGGVSAEHDHSPRFGLPPDVEHLLAAMVRCRVIKQWYLDEIVEEMLTEDDAMRLILGFCLDHVRKPGRASLARLAIGRTTQRLNGSFGVMRYEDLGLEPETLRQLVEAGWVHDGSRGAWLPPNLRDYILWMEGIFHQDRMVEGHERFASAYPVDGLEYTLEAHYHALEAGDAEKAKTTAIAYGQDLRVLARRLSEQGKFAEAASLYRLVVEEYDQGDAYSWHYFAFNHARSGSSDVDSIRSAYERSVELDSLNTLFKGRFLGYKAEHGDYDREDIDRFLGRTSSRHGAFERALKAILDALGRSNQRAELRDLLSRWETRARHSDEIQKMYGDELAELNS